MEFSQNKICEIDLFDFTSFFGLDFFKFSGPLWAITCIKSCTYFYCTIFLILEHCAMHDFNNRNTVGPHIQ